MAITVNSVALSTGQPSAPVRHVKITATPDTSYPTGGYDVSASLEGGTVVASPTVPHYNGTTLRWFKVSSAGKLQAFANSGGAPGAEVTAATNLSAHANVTIEGVVVQ